MTDTCHHAGHRVPIPELPMLTNAANTAGQGEGLQAPSTAAWRDGECRGHKGQGGKHQEIQRGVAEWQVHEVQVIGLIEVKGSNDLKCIKGNGCVRVY